MQRQNKQNGGKRDRIEDFFSDTAQITEAMQRAIYEAILDHKRAGNPIATMRDGRVVWIQPEDIEIPEIKR
jgi:hypothetical protein